MEAKILSEDGAELGPEEIGELALSGRMMMKGYHNNLQATNMYYFLRNH